jgi:large subunit ribosomal protein L24
LSGQLGSAAGGIALNASTLLESNEPRALLAWLMHRSDAQILAAGPLRLGGEITIDNNAVTVERLKLALDRMSVAGRLAYAWASEDRPARLDAALTSSEIDLDRAHAVGRSLLGEATLGWPGEGTISLKIARALVAGTEAREADVNVRIGAKELAIEQLAIADLGGAALKVKGRIDTGAISPRGTLTLDLDARSLDGALMLMDRISPRAAEELRRAAHRVTPLTLRASVALDPGKAAGTESMARLKLEGRFGAFRVALQGDGNVSSEVFKIDGLDRLGAAKVNLTGRLEADDARALMELAGLDRQISVEQRPARLAVTATGPLDGELAITSQLAAGALDISTNGKISVFDPADRSANLDLKVANAHIRSPRPAPAGRPAEFVPASIKARLTFSAGTLHLADLKGTVAGTSVGGRLSIGVQQPFTLDGDIALGAVDLPAAIATAIGIPAQQGSGTGSAASSLWPAEPFEQMPHRLNGQVVLRSDRAALTPKLAARDFRGVIRFGDAEFSLQAIEGSVVGGRIGGDLLFQRHADGLTARGRVKLAGANAAELVPGGGVLSGRLSFDAAGEGSGMSVIALIGSLTGTGTFLLENAKLAGLDPSAFDAVIRAVDHGLPIDAARVRDKTESALRAGGLTIPLAEGAFTINAGQARVSNTVLRAQGADLTMVGNLNFAEAEIDTRLVLSGTGGSTGGRPEIGITLRGPIDAPKRTTDVAMLANWLAMRAVEQQARKLDALEGRALPSQATPAKPDAVVEGAQPGTAAGGSDSPSAARSAPEGARPRPPARSKARPSSSPEQAQPLPPPIDIRPAPAPRAAPRPAGAQGTSNQGRGQTAAPPPRPRSLSEILFGN